MAKESNQMFIKEKVNGQDVYREVSKEEYDKLKLKEIRSTKSYKILLPVVLILFFIIGYMLDSLQK